MPCTDVTGFGLGGHLIEAAKGADVCIEIYTQKIDMLDGVEEFAAMGLLPAGAHKNKSFFAPHCGVWQKKRTG